MLQMRALAILVLATGCSQGIDRDYYLEMDRLLYEGQTPLAAQYVQQMGPEAYGELNQLLYLLDYGMALQLADQYDASSKEFEAAYRLAADLYTKNVSGELASFFTSDNSIPYYGEEFERVLMLVFNALNYAYRGDYESALVEARRVDLQFRTFSKGRYEFDPFALYLSGLLAESAGELDDAWISYERAFDAYNSQAEMLGLPVPTSLLAHWAGVSKKVGREAPEGIAKYAQPDLGASGELVIFHYMGPGPRKIERFLEMSVGDGFAIVQATDIRGEDQKQAQQAFSAAKGLASTTQVSIAYPIFEQPPLTCGSLRVEAPGCEVRSVERVHNVSGVAYINLEDRVKAMWGRIVARAVVKFVTARTAGAVGEQLSGNSFVGNLIGAVTQAALSATESADVRGWRTLPAEIWMTRMVCGQGAHQVRIRQHHRQYGEIYDDLSDVLIQPGRTVFRYAACY